jgi:hypothetical protein
MEFPNLMQKFDHKMQVIIEKQNRGLADLVEKMVKRKKKLLNQSIYMYNGNRENNTIKCKTNIKN